MKITLELVERFHEKWILNPVNGCWEWTASLNGNGYGQIKRPGERRQYIASRLSYLIHYGAIPDGMFVLHTCDNRLCVKPSHLFLGTADDNAQDMKAKGRHTHGVTGHSHKINDDKARQIHKLKSEGVSQSEIGRIFGLSQSTIWKILTGQKWKHIYKELHGQASSTAC